MRFQTIVRLASFCLLSIFLLIAWVSVQFTQRQLHAEIEQEIIRAQTAFTILQNELGQMLLSIADLLASDAQIKQLIWEGRKHLRAEGGSAGGPQTAITRALLMQRIFAQWERMERDIDLRQLHFHIAPEGVSFLRMIALESFGDDLLSVRPLVADVQRDGMARSGFEIGPTFAGLRAVAPIRAPAYNLSGAFEIIGSLEVGVSVAGHIERLSAFTQTGYGLLLNADSGVSHMQEGYQPPRIGEDYLLAASRPELQDWLHQQRLPEYAQRWQQFRISQAQQTFEVVRFPLYEYTAHSKASGLPVGSVILWIEISPYLQEFHTSRRYTLVLVAAGYLVTQIMLFLLLNHSRQEWQIQLDESTQAIRHLSQQNTLLLNTVGEGIIGLNRHGKVTFANPSALSLLKYERSALLGKDHRHTFHRLHPPHDCAILQSLADGQTRQTEDRFMAADGIILSVLLTVAPMEQGHCRIGVALVFRDISEMKAKEAHLLEMATTDALTGVANRRCFMEKLKTQYERLIRLHEPCAVIMADLDFFKRINDTYGHAAGDTVLQQFSRITQSNLRKMDLLGRIGGEEFAILMPGKTVEEALPAAQRIRHAIEQAHIHADGQPQPIQITVSMGISAVNPRDTTLDAVLKRADEALYTAKQNGRNRIECA